jgi:UDP-N-acetylglucosamine diphosphorylase/glucosamine-1-phosphate N-acetyltransferase
MRIVVFEDYGFKNLLPVVYFRPVWELMCGSGTLLDKIQTVFPKENVHLQARQYLKDYYLESSVLFDTTAEEDTLFINGRVLLNSKEQEKFLNIPDNSLLNSEKGIAAWRVSKRKIADYFENGVLREERVLSDFTRHSCTAELIEYPWDLIDRNGQYIKEDFENSGKAGKVLGQLDDGAHIMGRDNIYIGEGARVMPGVVINAEDGPVWISEKCKIMPNSVLEGPLYIGEQSIIKIGAKIYENSTIGKVCKVGGELEGSIIQEFSNKQHDGFLGHSYLGAWINLGADTNNSDLKNNYGEISVYINNQSVETGKRFLGTIMGDHSKTAINTQLNTGTVVGVSCNIFGEGFPPKFIPSFSWGGASGFREYNFEKAMEVAGIVMGRRKIKFGDMHAGLFKAVKELSIAVENRARVRS